jgi:soluble lytic murein transglycosylase-like protein
VLNAVTSVESHGNGTAVSPKGALGSTQLMPETAREMAGKLGLPFRPDMLKSNDRAALNYQRSLAGAYLKEGLDKTGNLTDALHYYHGGPDRSMWGRLTKAYADAVLNRLGVQ